MREVFVGAKGGNGLLLVRKNNSWSGPFFYTMGGVSFGIQFGLKSSKVILTVMTEKGLKSILKERVKFGWTWMPLLLTKALVILQKVLLDWLIFIHFQIIPDFL